MNIPRLLFRLLLGRRLPITTGTLKIPGINQPVLIRRDRYGIPYIETERDEDAWYGLGFCHGQDRAFQIEGLLRVTRGTLAELIGPEALPLDRLSRRIGFHNAAEQQLEALDDENRQTLAAYARGVTDGAKRGCRRPAHEFTLLRTQSTPYRAADVLAVGKLLSFTLASNWDIELARLKILSEDGPEALAALDPAYPEWLPVTSPPTALAGSTVDRLAEDLAVFTATVGQGGGSNNWAIAPSHTATGRALLANDPHLAPALPPHWYLAHVRTPDWAVAGAAFIGVPGFFVGHNDTAAWGVTAGLLDNTDLFIEEIGPDGRSIREGDQFVRCETRLEIIRVKGGETVEEEVLVTPRGPIIGPALEGEVGAISLRATWLDPRPAKGFFQIHRARSFEAFRRALAEWPFASFNMVYADTSGTVGWQLVGEAPQRRKGWGTIPLPGWDPEVGWENAPIPFNKMPHLANPETGFVASANTRPTPEDEDPFLGVDWIDGYRLARIVEALDGRHDWDLASVQALQMDQKSLPWRELHDIVLATPAETDEARNALALLETWGGVVTAGSPAATIFELFVTEMVRRMVETKAPRATQWALGTGFTPLVPYSLFTVRRVGHLVRLLREQPEGWFERPWPQEMADALTTIIRTLRQDYGDDPRQWAWGHIRPLTLRHPVGERAALDRVFNLGPFPWGGDANTVGQAATDPIAPTANPAAIASLRMVVDVGNWEASRFVLPGGQSGNPVSPHYDDLLPLWQRGEGVPIAWSQSEVERVTRSVLRLVPRIL
ncbi:MAG: penicillin acylase family protein [Candidatus Bipolaricaulia bacterium]